MATVFFSYSHKDEDLRDQLEVHLSGLKRQGVISTWHDRRITAGSDFGNAIDENLKKADVILLFVSPDFINSDYCYEREMTLAMERHESGEARVIPVILRACDWHGLPFGKLLAAPTDGKAVTKWADRDEAFLSIVQAIKAALKEMGQNGSSSPTNANPTPTMPADVLPSIRSSNLRIRKQFTDLDRDSFRHEGFDFIAKFFEASLLEIVKRNPDLAQRFQRVDANHFTAAIYQNGVKVCVGSASVGSGMMGANSVQYSMTDTPRDGSMNEALYVKNDDQALYFEPLGMQSYGSRDKQKLTFQGAAEFFWDLFIRPLQ
jgi:TIR domain